MSNQPAHHPSDEPAAIAATFMFADIAGFTALTEAHGDQEAAKLVGDFCDAVDAELPAFGGTQVKMVGDALMLHIPDPGQLCSLDSGSLTTCFRVTAHPPYASVCTTDPRSNGAVTTSVPR